MYAENRSEEYWAGWALAYYQWEAGMSFEEINLYVPIKEVMSMYYPFHEMDIRQFVDAMNVMIGESAGAIICAPSIQYIEQMDEKPEDYSQEDDAGLDLIDFYVLPHYLTAPFKKVTEKIMTEFSDLNLCPINNRQGIVIDGEGSKVICKD